MLNVLRYAYMTPKQIATFRIDDDLLWALRVVKERDGVPISEQVRQAIERAMTEAHATAPQVHQAFDQLEETMAAASNRSLADLAAMRLPQGFGKLSRRLFSTLTEDEMASVEVFAHAAGRATKAHRDF